MHAQVRITRSIRETLRYHEQKVKQGKAECLDAGNFVKDADQLTLDEKVYHFQRLYSLNERIKRPTVHISLNFHPAQFLSDDDMRSISRDFMQKMGMEEHPYLVYRHDDAAHPHLHLVTTTIRNDGSVHYLTPQELRHAKEVTEELEEKWSLVRSVRHADGEKLPLGHAHKIRYGEEPVYRALRDVIEHVVNNYHYTNMDELNAVLRLYNAEAYMGRPGSRLNEHKGLIYRVLDEDGKAVKTTIKASLFDSKPTLKKLEEKFSLNEQLRESSLVRLTTAIDWALAGTAPSPSVFKEEMEKEGVSVVYRQDKEGVLQNIWYVDHTARAVFSGEMLGERYSASGINNRCIPEKVYQQQLSEREAESQHLRITHYGGL